MDCFQIPIRGVPLLEKVVAFLHAIPEGPAALKVETVGDWGNALTDGPPEAEDCDLPQARRSAAMPEEQMALARLLGPAVEVRAVHYYPSGGGMGWHTNSMRPGWRIYVPRVSGEHPDSGLLLPGRRVADRRDYANVFHVGHRAWHAVYANTARFSAGMRFENDDMFIRVLQHHPDAIRG